VRMPGLDGHEALAEIRKIPGMELVPAIAVTASTQPDDYFSGFIRKPFSTRELFNELAEFLPRHLPTEPSANAEARTVAETATDEPTPTELLARLSELLIEPWPSLCNTMAVNETKSFARELDILAEQWHCRSLKAYAAGLLRDAEIYAVTDMEKHLGEFAALVEQLKENRLIDKSGSTAAPPPGIP
jgi:hypothetical protein